MRWSTPDIANAVIASCAVAGLFLTANQIRLTGNQFEQQTALTRAQFRQENRPFIEIVNPQILFLKGFVYDNQYPALQFYVSADLKNHGKSPAYVARTEFILENLDRTIAKPFMPTPEDQEKYIKNIDIFPQEQQSLSWSPFLNFNDLGELVSVDSETVKNIKDLMMQIKQRVPSEPSKINVHTKDCYLIVQTEYSSLGDVDNKYFYSARFRVDLSEKFTCRIVETKIGGSEEKGKWYQVGPRSELSRLIDNTDGPVTKRNGIEKSHSPEKDSKSMNWKAIGAIGAILGGLGSFTAVIYLLFKETILARIRRPIINFEYDFKAPYVTRSDSDNAYFFHLGLMNSGKSVAKRCMVYLDEIHTKGANGWTRQTTFIPMVMHWVRESFSPTDIQRGQTKLIDIGNIPIDGAHQTQPYPFRLWFDGFSDITGVPHGEHIFMYSIYVDNFQNRVVWIKLNWRGQSASSMEDLKSQILLELLIDKPQELAQ